MSDKTFGQHIEDGLKSLGDSLVQHHRDTKKWNDESRALGLISTADKLRWLEAEAYRKARLDKDISQELALIATLRETKKMENRQADRNAESLANSARITAHILYLGFFGWYSFNVFIPHVETSHKICLENKIESGYCDTLRGIDEWFNGKLVGRKD